MINAFCISYTMIQRWICWASAPLFTAGRCLFMAVLLGVCGSTAEAQVDTIGTNRSMHSSGDSLDLPVPGRLTPRPISRDSALVLWFQQRINPIIRLREALRRDSTRFYAYLDSLKAAASKTSSAIMAQNLVITPDQWMPTKADQVNRELEIRRSQDYDFIHPQGITYVGTSIPLSSIGQALGLVEDVSPKFKYVVPTAENVSVIIYTLSAQPVATMVNAVQKAGPYSMAWNMLDSNGRRVRAGDYFVEVSVAKKVLFRKRIVVP